jgi:hypothetical protein
MPDATMPEDFPPATGYDHLITRLRADQPVVASRAVLEACFGLWSMEPELCEDGRATMLTRLPTGVALYLVRTGEVLAVHATSRAGMFQTRLFTGSGDLLWQAVAAHHPAAVPGRGLIPRYWSLREDVSPLVKLYAVYDLLSLEVIERAADRTAVARAVVAANSGCRRLERGRAVRTGVGVVRISHNAPPTRVVLSGEAYVWEGRESRIGQCRLRPRPPSIWPRRRKEKTECGA